MSKEMFVEECFGTIIDRIDLREEKRRLLNEISDLRATTSRRQARSAVVPIKACGIDSLSRWRLQRIRSILERVNYCMPIFVHRGRAEQLNFIAPCGSVKTS